MEVGGGPIGFVGYCQYAGLTTTTPVAPSPSPSTGSLSVRPTGVPGQLLVFFQSSAGRDALLPDSARTYAVTDQVQCLPSPVTECDTSSPDLWTDAPFLYTEGQVVSGLLPNTDYTCFASATYVKDGVTTYTCAAAEVSENDDVVLLPPTPPGMPTVTSGSEVTSEIVVAAAQPTGPQGDAQPVLGYAVQCLDASVSLPTACSTDGAWSSTVDANSLAAGVLVDSLAANTRYVCFAATVYGASGSEKYSCSIASDSLSTLPGPPTGAAISNPTHQSLEVVADLPDPVNGDAATVQGYAFQCLPASAADECSQAGTWFPSSAPFASVPTTPMTVSGLESETAYKCWAATVVGDSRPLTYYCSDHAAESSTLPFYPPTVAAASGSVPSQLAVTGTNPSPPNVGTTLKVACVASGGACPAYETTGWVVVTTSGEAVQVSSLADGNIPPTPLVGGTEYSCWSADFDVPNASRVCSSASSGAVVPLAAPTVLASSGAVINEVKVTGTNPDPPNAADATMKVACVALNGGCPAIDAGWVSATSGNEAQVATLADGTTQMAGGTSYTCWSAQYDTHGNYKCSAAGAAATASLLNRPTVAAAPGSTADQVAVTGTNSITANQGTTLKVACVAYCDACPAYDAGGWVDVTNSGEAVQVATLAEGTTSLVGGTSYTCWSLEYQTDDVENSICSETGAQVTANPLNAPTLVSAAPGSTAGTIDVTAAAPSSPANVDATLRVACVPNANTPPACPAADAGSTVWFDYGSTPQTIIELTAGDEYLCFAAEFADAPANTYRVCSAGTPAVAALNAPTLVSAAPGTSPETIVVTASIPTGGQANVDATLKVVCVTGSACPVSSATWVTVTTSGDPQPVGGLNASAAYTCYAAEFSVTTATYRVCSSGNDATANPLNAPAAVAAVTGTADGQIVVTPQGPTTANAGTTLNVACVASGASCPSTGWTAAGSNQGTPLTNLADGSAMTPGTIYACYAAEIDMDDTSIIACTSSAANAVAYPLTAPTALASPGSNSGEISVTANGYSATSGATLKVSCVAWVDPNHGGPAACPAATSSDWVTVTSGQAGTVGSLTAGAPYTCYAAQFADNYPDPTYRVCSSGNDATANPLNAPAAVAAVTGTADGQIVVTPQGPTTANAGTTLNVACVASGASCPSTGWTAAGSNQGTPLTNLADGSAMTPGTIYACYAAEIDMDDTSIIACTSSAANAVAYPLTAPTALASPGSNSGEISVTANGYSATSGATLKVSCVAWVDPNHGGPAACPAATSSDWVTVASGQAGTVGSLTAGAPYTCYAAQFADNYPDPTYRVCSSGNDATANPLNAPAAVAAVTGTADGQIVVTPQGPTTANAGTTLNVACVASGASCPSTGWTAAGSNQGTPLTNLADGSAMTPGTIYACYAAEIDMDDTSIIACTSSAANAVAYPLTAPTALASPGSNSGEISVTANGYSATSGATLKVSCVAWVDPNHGGPAACPAATSSDWVTVASGQAGTVGSLTAGAPYTCYAAQFADNYPDPTYRVCSSGNDATANPLNAPAAVAAVTGTADGQIVVTPQGPTTANAGTTLNVACVASGASCPSTGWTAAGSNQGTPLTNLADGSAMTPGTIYACYAAEIDMDDTSIIACTSSAANAVAYPLTAPTALASPGSNSGEISVTANGYSATSGATLKVSCVAWVDPNHGGPAACPAATSSDWVTVTSGQAGTVGSLTAGAPYTCYAAQFADNYPDPTYRVCSSGNDATANPLNAPAAVAAVTGTADGQIVVTPQGPTTANAGTTLNVACVASGASCPSTGWTAAGSNQGTPLTNLADGSAMTPGTIYACYAAEIDMDDTSIIACTSSAANAVAYPLTAPTALASPGSNSGEISVTANGYSATSGATLKVSCVAWVDPNHGGPAACPAATSSDWVTVTSGQAGTVGSLTAGAPYTCYAAQFADNYPDPTYRVCSSGNDATANPLNAPAAVAAVTGTADGQIVVTPQGPTTANAGTTLNVACVASGASCPSTGWTAAGSNQGTPLTNLADGSAMTPGTIYACYAAEIDMDDTSIIACTSSAANAVAYPLTAPTALASPGSNSGEISVTANGYSATSGATLKVSCVAWVDPNHGGPAACPAATSSDWVTVTSGQAGTVGSLTAGAPYTCYAAQFADNYPDPTYRVCSSGNDATANPLNAPAAVAAVTGTADGQIVVTPQGPTTANAGTTLNVACVASGASCPSTGWTAAGSNQGTPLTNLADGSAMTPGTIYACYAAEIDMDDTSIIACTSSAAKAVAYPLTAPTALASPGSNSGEISVTANGYSATSGATLKVSCVAWVDPNHGGPAACPAATSSDWVTVTSGQAGTVGSLTAGAPYTCYAAQFADNYPDPTYRVCSSGNDATANPLNAPAAVAAVTGTADGQIVVTPQGPTTANAGTTLNVACVASGASCPSTGWTAAGSNQGTPLTNLADGSAMTPGTIYACYAAEIDMDDTSIIACTSSAAKAVAYPLNAPTARESPGSNSGEISVTTNRDPATSGATLKVSCVPRGDPNHGGPAECPAATTSDSATVTSGQAGTNGRLTAAAPYTCYAAHMADNYPDPTYNVCSSGNDAKPNPLNATDAVATVTGTTDGQIGVNPQGPTTANTGTTLNVTCVAYGASCPSTGRTAARSNKGTPTTNIAEGSAINQDTSYACDTAESDMDDTTSTACTSPTAKALAHTPYYQDGNGLTVYCPGVAVGGDFRLGGIVYTKRDRAGLDALVAADPTDEAALATTCTTGVTDLAELFGYATDQYTSFSKVSDPTTFNPDLSSWDTSAVTNMHGMLIQAAAFNRDISSWDTSLVTDMGDMFREASAFNNGDSADDQAKPLAWTTDSVSNTVGMFRSAYSFNQDISSWNTGAVTTMESMFNGAFAFNNGGQALAWTDTGAVTDMKYMFYGAASFNQDISSWNTGAVTTMMGMFENARSFNQDISSWDTGEVVNMDYMFASTDAFNNGGQALDWTSTGKVTSMYGMFYYATTFNQDISGWNTGAVTNMESMFYFAQAFNQNLQTWNVGAVSRCFFFSYYSGMASTSPPRPAFTICTPY